MSTSTLASEGVAHTERTDDPVERALRIFLGWAPDVPLPIGEHLPARNQGLPDLVISWNQAPEMTKRLINEGYAHLRRFALLPSRKQVRWLLPLTEGRSSVDGFNLYKPFSPAARLMKAVVVRIRATGWEGWARHGLLVASRKPLPIENLVRDVTGDENFTFALSLGTAGAFQKLTVQMTRSDGVILGYLKMPLTGRAGERLQHEAAFLRKLSGFSKLRPHLPQLLFAGPWDGSHVVFESALEGETGPVRFTKLYEEFLKTLHSCRPAASPGRRLIEETARSWERVVLHLGTKWQDLGREVLRIATRELETSMISCGIQHGDFTPWNSRVHRGCLFVFDWESAAWEAPILWDQFHFLAQTECLLRANHESPNQGGIRDRNRALYLLYLLKSTAQAVEEEANQLTIDFRETQILRYVSGFAMAASN
ncbi:MAG: phosphotransferase [Candidatus Acidiferrales bacterium]